MITQFVKQLFPDKISRILKPYQALVNQINLIETQIQTLSDAELAQQTVQFKERLSNGESLDDILPEAFATVREVSVRVLNMRHFDVQLIGGMVMHHGRIAEMKTGEGKTLVSTLPAYLNALSEKGVYVVTVNDYLAKRDCEWMKQVFEFLGLSVGLIQSGMDSSDRLAAYNCDITYGTNNEFGFDYLRDNLTVDLAECCQSRRHFAIIDEVDSILIDEARTPLIISGPIQDSTSTYSTVVKACRQLIKDTHFTLDEKHKNAVLTDEGTLHLESLIGIADIFSIENMSYAHIATQCLRALYLYKKDVDYVVKDGEVVIVDEFTGRLMDGRRYSDGLHQSIEACEGLTIKQESQTLASITFQNYFRMFPKLAGMTGTAETEAAEFGSIYGLGVVPIPTNKPMIREDASDLIYKTKSGKFNAIVSEIKRLNQTGQPVLVGTISIETSEQLSHQLRKSGIQHSVLNAKHHQQEADIISKAGQRGAVTIATNMAGRGTDIVLGDGVEALGGLAVLGTERHESRRIDNQLRGRSGRQGDNGFSRFYVSLEDELMRLFGSDKIASIMDRLGMPDDMPIEHGLINRSIEKAQHKVEKYHFSMRKQILQYDDVMTQQRQTIYQLRHDVLVKRDLISKVHEFISVFVNYSDQFGDQKKAIAQFSNHFASYPTDIVEEIIKQVILQTIDRKWIDHQQNMDILREGIGLRAWGQRDPLIEYKREAFDLFNDLLVSIKSESFELLMRVNIVVNDEPLPLRQSHNQLEYNHQTTVASSVDNQSSVKLGRNDLCSCGSGKKYKRCCMS